MTELDARVRPLAPVHIRLPSGLFVLPCRVLPPWHSGEPAMNIMANITPSLTPRLVAIMAFDGVAALDLTGPLEALSIARFPGGKGEALPCYMPVVIGLEKRSFTSESGLIFKAEACAESSDSFDTILIPGGSGLRQPETIRRVAGWLA